MPFASFARAVLAAAATFAAAVLPAAAQTVNPPLAAGNGPFAAAVNPVTNRIYIASEFSNAVTVIDGETNATTSIPVGTRPEFIAVNPVTNKVYVNNALDATLTEIDGATNTPTTYPIGSWGPISINPVTNKVYIVRFTGPSTDEVTVFDADTKTWYTMATLSFQPVAMALNPVTNMLYVAHYASGHIRAIDGDSTSDHPPSTEIGVWGKPVAVTVNPVTNKVYVLTEDPRGPIAIIDGSDNSAVFLTPEGHATGPRAVAVNPVTNKVYAAFAGEVIVIDGATNALTFIPSGTAAEGPVAIGINQRTNKIYVPNANGSLTVIDGASNTTTTLAIPAGARGVGINPVTNKAYVVGDEIIVVDGAAGDTVQANPIATTITPLPGHSGGPNPTITLNAASGFSPTAPAILKVYYQMDGAGPWVAATGSGPYTASPTGLSPGSHTIRAFAIDAQAAPSTVTQQQSTPLIGNIVSYTFTATGTESAVLAFQQATHAVSEAGPSVTLSVTRTGSSSGAVSVNWAAANGTAAAGSDYGTSGSATPPSGTLTWAAGDSTPRTITIPIVDDASFEDPENFTVTLSSPSAGAQLGSTPQALVVVNDDERSFELGAALAVNEAGPNVTLVVSRRGPVDEAASVRFSTSNGTAIAGSDYAATSEVLQFAAGQRERTIAIGPDSAAAPHIAVLDDLALEDPETFTIALSSPSGGWTIGSAGTATITIHSDDRRVALASGALTVSETAGTVSLQVNRTGAASGAVSVGFAFDNHTAINGTHYNGTPGTLSWGDGDMAPKSIVVGLVDDAAHNDPRGFSVTLLSPVNAALGTPASANVTITNDDEPSGGGQTLAFAAPSYATDESGATILQVQVLRSGGTAGAASVTWSTAGGTAEAGSDFGTLGNSSPRAGTLSWAAGDGAPKTITVGRKGLVPILNDGVVEPDESFTLELSGANGAALGAQSTTTIQIADDDSEIRLAATTATVGEGGPNVLLQVTRSGGLAGAASVQFATANGSATSPGDYTATTGVVSFAAGESTKSIAIGPASAPAPWVRVLNDTALEGPETFTVTLTSASGASLGTPTAATVTIDSDDRSVGMADASVDVAEAAGTVQVQVLRNGPTDGAVSVSYAFENGTALGGTHYNGTPGTLTWASGDGSAKSIPVQVVNDGGVNAARTFRVTLSGATGASLATPSATTVRILDDDNTLQFSAPTASVAEGAPTVTLTVSRVGGAAQAASVGFSTADGTAIAGTDFGTAGVHAQVAGTVSWAAGDSAPKTVVIPILDDTVIEGAKTFTVTLSGASGGSIGSTSTATVTINDNDQGVVFTAEAFEVSENERSVVLSVTRTGPANDKAAVRWTTANGTAMAGSEFGTVGSPLQRTGTVAWGLGDTSPKTITIPILNDVTSDGDKSFTVELHSPTAGLTIGTPGVATVTVRDDDIPPESELSFTQPKFLALEDGGNATITVTRTALDGGGFERALSVSYATVAGTAIATGDFTARSGTLVWAAGESGEKAFTVPIANDGVAEAIESFRVRLSNSGPAGRIATPEAAVLVVDDDEAFPPSGAVPADWIVPSGAAGGWHVSNDPGALEGAYALRSDMVGDGESAQVQVAGTFAGGTVAFRFRVSSEAGFDALRFYVDGNLAGEWSGTSNTAWQSFTLPLAAGAHTLRWSYEKDGSASMGSDAAWLDAVTLPAMAP